MVDEEWLKPLLSEAMKRFYRYRTIEVASKMAAADTVTIGLYRHKLKLSYEARKTMKKELTRMILVQLANKTA